MKDNSICRSVFQNGTQEPTRQQVTEMWINLIYQLEASKTGSFQSFPSRDKNT